MPDRGADLDGVSEALRSAKPFRTEHALVVKGDSLEMLRRIPDASVSLILTDPPYHSTKKANIYGDKAFQEDEHFLGWMEQYAVEWSRVLRPSGTVYLFCSSDMAARLEVCFSKYMKPINTITWTKPNDPGYDGWKGKMNKESLRRWYPHSERILVFEHGTYGTYEAYRRSPLGQYLLECRLQAGITAHDLTGAIGAYGKVNHGGAVANWEAGRNIPSREQYAGIVEVLEATGNIPPMLPYEDIVRRMNVSGEIEFTDVWTFPSVRPYSGKHPAEKPLEMLLHAIRAATFEGDIVLDCFAGSGATAVAALLSNRRTIAFEIEERWVERISERVLEAEATGPVSDLGELRIRQGQAPRAASPALFELAAL